jgi:uncharacterized membrane protein
VTRKSDSGLAALLQKGGLKVQVTAPEMCRWTLEDLTRYSAVLLENVPAEKIGHSAMELLATWVKETGAGLMMTGGKDSYATGGYYKSPLDPILPVSMERRDEHRKLQVAIVVALDRSGSMAMPVGGGLQKMDLANQGTVAVLDLLSPLDEFGCIAIDTEPHIIAPLGRASDKGPTRNKIRRIESMGGGIFVYVALEAAVKMLTTAKAMTRHIILFSDANDSEEPGKYKELLEKTTAAGITVSVIGLGKKTDKDGALLEDIAARGKGRCFFTDKAEELPRLFAQDTFVVARNTFLTDPVKVKETAGLTLLAGRSLGFSEREIGGYNLCYLREEANLASQTEDEYKAPLVASWQHGTGRVLCFTGEADGKYAGQLARWERAGEFWTSLARWTAGQSGPLPDNMLVTQEVRNGVALVQLHLDPDRKKEAFTDLPKVTILKAEPGEAPRKVTTSLHWIGADTLAIEVPLQGTEMAVTTVEVGSEKPVVLPPVCLPYSPELKPYTGESGTAALEKLARATGGKERVVLASIWSELPRKPRPIRLAPWLLSLAVLLVLLEVFERRTGLLSRPRWLTRSTVEERTARRAAIPTGPASVQPPSAPLPEPTAPVAPAPAPALTQADEAGGMVDALKKAKQRTRARMD